MNRKLGFSLTVFILVLALAFFGYNALKKTTTVSNNQSEKSKAIDITLTTRTGKTIKLSSLYGKPTVLNFWASWCPPCKGEMPDFNKVYKEVGNEVNFAMVDLVDGQRETMATGKQHIKTQGYSFPVYYDVNQEAADTYKVYSIPTTYFIDKNGNVVSQATGAISESALREAIAQLTK